MRFAAGLDGSTTRTAQTIAVLGLLATLAPWQVHAHLDLVEPRPRLGGPEGGSQLKIGPCGQTLNARTDRVTVYEPGSTITVRWDEYIDHPGYFRIAFDVEGSDDFPIRPNQDDVDPATDDPERELPLSDVILKYETNDRAGGLYETEVTLPDVECETCTLQVIQFMYDKVGSGTDNEYYFQCADIALRRDGGPMPVPPTDDENASGEDSTSSGPDPSAASNEPADSESCTIGSSRPPLAWLLIAVFGLRIRRRSPRRAAI